MNIDEIKERLRVDIEKEACFLNALPPSGARLSPDGERLYHAGVNRGMAWALQMLEELPPEAATAERDHLRAQVTELQAAGTAHVYERRGMLARCAGRDRERNGDVEHHPRWLAGWDAADELLRRDVGDVAPADPLIVGHQAAVDTAAAKLGEFDSELGRVINLRETAYWALVAAREKLETARANAGGT